MCIFIFRESDTRLVTFDDLSSESVINYVQDKRKYKKIFLEDDILLNEYLDDNPNAMKADLLIAGYLSKNQEEVLSFSILINKFICKSYLLLYIIIKKD